MVELEYFEKYKDAIRNFKSVYDRKDLLMEDFKTERVYYAPVDYMSTEAKIIIVRLSPGEHQMKGMLREAKRLLDLGTVSDADIIRFSKRKAYPEAKMKANFIMMMDELGISRFLGVPTADVFFSDHPEWINFTSCVKYPAFSVKKGKETKISGDITHMKRLIDWAAPIAIKEFETVPNAPILAFGPYSHAYLELILKGTPLEKRLMPPLPHPSFRNTERIGYFLGHLKRNEIRQNINFKQLDEDLRGIKHFIKTYPAAAPAASE